MKITVSVAGAASASSSAIRCSAEFEAEAIDQGTLDRIVQTVQQCEAAVHRTQGHAPRAQGHAPEPSGSPPARPDSRSAAAKRLATEPQLRALRAITHRRGLRLASELESRSHQDEPSTNRHGSFFLVPSSSNSLGSQALNAAASRHHRPVTFAL